MTAPPAAGKRRLSPTATSTFAKRPQWGRPADPQPHTSTIPASATERPPRVSPDMRLNAQRRQDRA